MNDMHGIIFAYGSPTALRELCDHRTVSSIPVGSRYRTIDFILSSMTNAGISDIGVIMRESYQSLLDHLGSGKDWDLNRKRGGLKLLPPFGLSKLHGIDEYRGSMEALGSILSYIQRIRQKYVVLADGDILTNLDISAVLSRHIDSGADITAVCAADSGLVQTDLHMSFGADGFAEAVYLSGSVATSRPALGVYVLSKELLEKLIEYCMARSLYSFEENVLQKMCGELKIAGYTITGFAAKLTSTSVYFAECMRMLDKGVRNDLFPRGRTIKTKVRDEAPTYYAPGSSAKNCLIADGCYIEGEVSNSVIFRGVKVAKGAKIENSILMQDTEIGEDAVLSYVITDKDVKISAERKLMGHDTYPVIISKGTVV